MEKSPKPRFSGRFRRPAAGPAPAGLLAFFLLLSLCASAAAQVRGRPLALAPEEETALQLLDEVSELIEERYAATPDMKKVFSAGLYGLQRPLGKDRLQVVREHARLYTLRIGNESFHARFGAGGERDRKTFRKVYRFILSQSDPSRRPEQNLQLMYSALNAMLHALDPHSSFLSPRSYREMEIETKGKYGGLGMTVSIRENHLVVVSPIDDSPAARAGIQAGDELVAIDGEKLKGKSLLQSVRRLRGPPGTRVDLTVSRAGWKSPRTFSLARALIQTKSVKGRILKGNFGYLRITTFHEGTTRELDRHLQIFRKKNVRGIVLDLRNNPGGLLRQAVNVAGRFLPEENLIVFTRGRRRDQQLQFRTYTDGLWRAGPLIVLINQGSASASEIVAGAFRDLGRAILIGQTSYGKGSVQTIIPLSNGSGVRLTTAMYYTPLGGEIHQKGIVPDVVMEETAARTPSQTGRRRRRVVKKIPPPGEPDPALEIALQVLREMNGGWDVEVARLTALQILDRKTKRLSKASPPSVEFAR